MAETMQGVVEEVINNGTGKGSGVRIGGHKYGVYNPEESGLDAISVGDSVSLRFTKKDGTGGITYKNVNGKITKMTGSAASSVAAAAPPAVPARSYGGKGVFPIPLDDGQRSIIRQNALTNARELVCKTIKDGAKIDTKVTDTIIGIAKEFEAYTAGDIERFAAKEADKTVDDGFEIT